MITVVLNGYNRGHLLEEQISAIKNQSIKPTEILLWYNKGEVEQKKIIDDDIRVVYCDSNFKFHGRFALALLAKTEYIVLFDDDIIPGRKWLEHCLDYIKKLNGIIGASGVYLNSDNYENSVKYGYNGSHNMNDVVEVDLVGHSWFFRREWLQYMWKEYPVSWENGEDMQFSCFCKKHGGIKTYVPPMTSDIERRGNIKDRYGGDEYASWRKTGHSNIRDEIVKKLVDNGWKTVKMLKK